MENFDRLIKEFIDSELNLIGYNDVPENSPDLESNVGSKPTDYNIAISQQNYQDNFLGRFGFWFYESDEHDLLKADIAKKIYNFISGDDGIIPPEQKSKYETFADSIIELFKYHTKKQIDTKSKSNSDDNLSETEVKVQEDKLTDKKDTSFIEKKDSEILPEKVKRITDLIADLVKSDKDLLLKQLNK